MKPKLKRRLKITPRMAALVAAGLVVVFVLLRGRGGGEETGILADPAVTALPPEEPLPGGGAGADLSGVEGALGEIGGLLATQSTVLADISASLADIGAGGGDGGAAPGYDGGGGGGGYYEPAFTDYVEPLYPEYASPEPSASVGGAVSGGSTAKLSQPPGSKTLRWYGETFSTQSAFRSAAGKRGQTLAQVFANHPAAKAIYQGLPAGKAPTKKTTPAKGAGGQAPRAAPGNARASGYTFRLPSGELLRTKKRAQTIAKQQGLTLAQFRSKFSGLEWGRLG